MIALVPGLVAVIAAALVVALLLSRPSAPAAVVGGSSTATRTPAPGGSPSPTALPAAPSSVAVPPGAPEGAATAAPPVIAAFSVTPQSVTCSTPAAGVPGLMSAPLRISWSTTGGVQAWIGVDTNDAEAEPYSAVPPASGSLADLQYSCFADHDYTLTVTGPDGQKTSATIRVTNIGDR